ncbi:hypothetical protein LSTR_LSTR011172 [Laodelphax striatellus]|uniref:Cytochrome P450 n=1 Tax=Laodelphax striatellus TaxID=195883 RepID=A0A482XSU0_LAOST|nr:hypothetical protein LSTR_LSTR011172 [Laodelphax striatellus]
MRGSVRLLTKRYNSSSSVCPAAVESAAHAKVDSEPRPYAQVPGPKPIPLLGNTWRLLPLIGQYQISDLAKVSKILYNEYGKIVKLSGLVGRPDLLFVYDAQEIEMMYRTETDAPHRPSMPCLVKYKSEVRKDFFGRLPGVVGVHGEPWREFRTKVQRPILRPAAVVQYIQPIEEVTNQFLDRMLQIRDEQDELPNDFDNDIHKWALECIGRIALDVRLGCLDPNLADDSEPMKIINGAKFALRNIALLELKFPFWRYVPTPLWGRYVKNMDYFIEICMKHIDKAQDRLQKKLDAGTPESEFSVVERILMSDPDPKLAYVLALDLILVGIDTISMAVCSVLYQLATRTDAQEKMYKELKKVLPTKDTPLTNNLLENMPYTRSFIKEVLRMYSTVIGNGRTLLEDKVICGYNIPKGVQLVFPTIVTGNMPEYVKDPDHFYPERWLKEHKADYYRHPFASLPYGFGVRMCLGRRFADLEMQILLAKLVRSYKLEYHHEPLEYKVTFMYAPEGPLRFKMTPRDD